MKSARSVAMLPRVALRTPTKICTRNNTTLPWYRQEISTIVAHEKPSVSLEDLRRLMTLPKGREIISSEIQQQGRSPKAGNYVPLAQKKQQDRIWSRLQRVLSEVEKNDSGNVVAMSDAYTAAFQALSQSNMPYESMETLLRHMQGQKIPVSTGVHLAMLYQARGTAIVQVLRKLKASRATAAILNGQNQALLPTDIQALHYRANEAFIKTIHLRYMDSTTSTFSIENYQDLYLAMIDALPQFDPKLMERTISAEHLEKLAVASVRAPAMCGLADIVLDRLDSLRNEYAGRSALVPALAFEAAIEGFSSVIHGLIIVPQSTLKQLSKSSAVLSSSSVKTLRNLERSIGAPLTEEIRALESQDVIDEADPELMQTLKKASRYMKFVLSRIGDASFNESSKYAAREAMIAADGLVCDIHDMYAACGHEKSVMSLHIALLKQYFVAASRLDRRIPNNSAFQDELVFRIFRTLDTVASSMTDEEKDLVLDGLNYAFRALVVLFRLSEATMVLDMKETLFPQVPRRVDEYDDLIMALCANRKTRFYQPMQILQRMHNQGMQPTPLTMHRLVTFRMFQLEKTRMPTISRKLTASKTFAEMERTLEKWNIQVPQKEHHPLQFHIAQEHGDTIDDIITFLIDWHNMTGVVPFGKTLKLVADHCTAHKSSQSNHIHELSRLVQWTSSLPIEPATQVYLEHLVSDVA